jgi:predicted DNA-binding transcriptional regulator YafY
MLVNETSRLSRLTAILTQLQTKRLITATELADKFKISVRTIYRDIKALEASGIPICVVEGKGYSLMEGYRLPPIAFSEAEANALITAEQIVLKNKDTSFIHSYTEAITKIKSVLKGDMKDKADLLSQSIVIRQNPTLETNSDYLSAIQLSLTNRFVLQIKYLAPEAEKMSERSIEPFAIYSTQDNWLLIAWCRLRKDFRVFRLDRIQQLEILDQKYEPQKITLQEYFEICKEKSFFKPDTD